MVHISSKLSNVALKLWVTMKPREFNRIIRKARIINICIGQLYGNVAKFPPKIISIFDRDGIRKINNQVDKVDLMTWKD